MDYAYPAGSPGEVGITLSATSGQLKFCIIDSGKPFDPTTRKDADTTLSAEERPIGGLGIFLVRQLMDKVSYERTDGKNMLTLLKNI
jgi:anti-sigma regulatory factor (Ser/Thr protein kinase)